MPAFLPPVARWFLESGIQEAEGGVARYYLSDKQRNAPVSTEITGYALSAYLYLYKVTDDPRHREAAVKAGRFLCDLAWDETAGIFPFEWSRDARSPFAYFFDCGIIARGLLRLHEATGEEKYLQRARQSAEGMLRDFVSGGEIDPIVELPSKKPARRDGRWSRSPGCYQLKSALAWLEVGERTGDARLVEAYERARETAIATQAGFPAGEGEGERVMDRLHAYSYYLEGLLPRCGDAAVDRALAAGIDEAGRRLRQVRPIFERSDVSAQLLRVRLHAAQAGAVRLDEAAAGEEASWATNFQTASSDPQTNGSFCFGRKGTTMLPFANPVSGAFCLQALWQWETRDSGEPLDWRELI